MVTIAKVGETGGRMTRYPIPRIFELMPSSSYLGQYIVTITAARPEDSGLLVLSPRQLRMADYRSAVEYVKALVRSGDQVVGRGLSPAQNAGLEGIIGGL